MTGDWLWVVCAAHAIRYPSARDGCPLCNVGDHDADTPAHRVRLV